MCSSAIRSSSSIDTPGSSPSATSASVSATSAPARAIPSIAWLLLRRITGDPRAESARWAPKSERCKDAGSGRSLALRPRPRTQQRDALQATSACDTRRGLPKSRARLHRGERLLNLVEDLADCAVGVHADDVAARRAVVLDERRGLTVVRVEPLHRANHVAGRDVRETVGLRELRRLRSLAGALRTEQQDVQRRKPS